jgi:hypothetical protein
LFKFRHKPLSRPGRAPPFAWSYGPFHVATRPCAGPLSAAGSWSWRVGINPRANCLTVPFLWIGPGPVGSARDPRASPYSQQSRRITPRSQFYGCGRIFTSRAGAKPRPFPLSIRTSIKLK